MTQSTGLEQAQAEQNVKNAVHPKGGWRQDEIDLLFSAVSEAAETGKPLRDVFEDVGSALSRKPNSIRNFYYARVRETPDLAARQAPFRSFTEEEIHHLLRQVLIGRGQGESVRSCVTRLAQGDRAGMLRYQNKYRSILKNRPDMLLEVAEELKLEGLPCPAAVTACRRYERASHPDDTAQRLRGHLSDPLVRSMVENLLSLLESKPSMPENMMEKWQEARREADRLKVEVDLLKMALEDAREMQRAETEE